MKSDKEKTIEISRVLTNIGGNRLVYLKGKTLSDLRIEVMSAERGKFLVINKDQLRLLRGSDRYLPATDQGYFKHYLHKKMFKEIKRLGLEIIGMYCSKLIYIKKGDD